MIHEQMRFLVGTGVVLPTLGRLAHKGTYKSRVILTY